MNLWIASPLSLRPSRYRLGNRVCAYKDHYRADYVPMYTNTTRQSCNKTGRNRDTRPKRIGRKLISFLRFNNLTLVVERPFTMTSNVPTVITYNKKKVKEIEEKTK